MATAAMVTTTVRWEVSSRHKLKTDGRRLFKAMPCRRAEAQ